MQSAAARFGPALKAFLLCLLIGGSGVGYVWQKDQIIRLDRRIRQGEARLSAADDRNDSLRKQLTAMRSPPAMQHRMKELGLVEPLPAQKWRLVEPLGDAPSAPELASPYPGQIAHAARPR